MGLNIEYRAANGEEFGLLERAMAEFERNVVIGGQDQFPVSVQRVLGTEVISIVPRSNFTLEKLTLTRHAQTPDSPQGFYISEAGRESALVVNGETRYRVHYNAPKSAS